MSQQDYIDTWDKLAVNPAIRGKFNSDDHPGYDKVFETLCNLQNIASLRNEIPTTINTSTASGSNLTNKTRLLPQSRQRNEDD